MDSLVHFVLACVLLYYAGKLYAETFRFQQALPLYAPLISLTRIVAYIMFVYTLLRLLIIPFILILLLVIVITLLSVGRSYRIHKNKTWYHETY